MPYLIDGYNLLYAMGMLRGRTGPTGLQKARLGLLGLLAAAYGEEAGSVTVVFDAAGAPPGAPAEFDYQGLHVRFAVQEREADDLIEDLIRRASAPRRQTVVSDDHRIHEAGRRRHCTILSCQEYLEWLARHRRERRRPAPRPDAKPEAVSAEESTYWLREFADLQRDPAWKELADPPEWQELDP